MNLAYNGWGLREIERVEKRPRMIELTIPSTESHPGKVVTLSEEQAHDFLAFSAFLVAAKKQLQGVGLEP